MRYAISWQVYIKSLNYRIKPERKKKRPHIDSVHILCSRFAHFKTITLTKVKQENPDRHTKGKSRTLW